MRWKSKLYLPRRCVVWIHLLWFLPPSGSTNVPLSSASSRRDVSRLGWAIARTSGIPFGGKLRAEAGERNVIASSLKISQSPA